MHSLEQPFLHLEWSSFPPVDSNHDTQIQSLKSCLLDEEGMQLDSPSLEQARNQAFQPFASKPSLGLGAGDRTRTGGLDLGKVTI